MEDLIAVKRKKRLHGVKRKMIASNKGEIITKVLFGLIKGMCPLYPGICPICCSVVQRVAACCSVLQCVNLGYVPFIAAHYSVLQHVAACCSVV